MNFIWGWRKFSTYLWWEIESNNSKMHKIMHPKQQKLYLQIKRKYKIFLWGSHIREGCQEDLFLWNPWYLYKIQYLGNSYIRKSMISTYLHENRKYIHVDALI